MEFFLNKAMTMRQNPLHQMITPFPTATQPPPPAIIPTVLVTNTPALQPIVEDRKSEKEEEKQPLTPINQEESDHEDDLQLAQNDVYENTISFARDPVNSIQNTLPSFLTAIIGKPNTGKSTFIKSLLDKEEYKDFAYILFVTPSYIDGINITSANGLKIYHPDIVLKKLSEQPFSNKQFLLILDDVISSIKANERNQNQINLFFNRRKILPNGNTLSIMLTTQRYVLIPQNVRSVLTQIYILKIQPLDLKKIKDEQLAISDDILTKLYKKQQDLKYSNIELDLNNSKIYFNGVDIEDFNFVL